MSATRKLLQWMGKASLLALPMLGGMPLSGGMSFANERALEVNVEQVKQRLLAVSAKANDQAASETKRTSIRGKIIGQISAETLEHLAQNLPLTSAHLDDLRWMEKAVQESAPFAKLLTTSPRDTFDPQKPIQINDGHLKQGNEFIFLFGIMKFDAPWAADLGVNLKSVTFGPKWTLPGPDFSRRQVMHLKKEFMDDHSVAHEVLYSAHQMPKWLLDSDPSLKRNGCGWLNYNLESPAAQQAHALTIETVLGNTYRMRPFPSLLINLANEPAYSGRDPEHTDRAWHAWLMREHGSIDALNEKWQTAYPSFSQVEVPAYVSSGKSIRADEVKLPVAESELPRFYDWSRFNDHRLADSLLTFKREMNAAYPGAFYHVKWLSDYPLQARSVARGTNPVPISKNVEILDCDSWLLYGSSDPEFALAWQRPLLSQTILRSIGPKKPLMNSENHLLSQARADDKSSISNTQPWSFFRLALWLEAVHNLQATFMWNWDLGPEPKQKRQDPGIDFVHRSQSLDAIAQALYEFAHFRREIAAIQNQQPEVAVVLSHASLTREAGQIAAAVPSSNPQFANGHLSSTGDRIPGQPTHLSTFCDVMSALMLLGNPVGVLLEDVNQDLSQFRAIIIPHAQWIDKSIQAKLQSASAAGIPILIVGAPPRADAYGRPLGATFVMKAVTTTVPQNAQAAHHNLQKWLNEQGLLPKVLITDSTGGIPYGLMWRVAHQSQGDFIFLANLTREQKKVSVSGQGTLLDLPDRKQIGSELNLHSLELRLLRLAP